jgi:hypothetical protein
MPLAQLLLYMGLKMPNTYILIASNTLGASAASVTFSAIPATFTDLVLRLSTRNDDTGANESVKMQVNNNTGSVYSTTYMYGEGTNAVVGRDTSVGDINDGIRGNGAGATSNTFANQEIYIPSYTLVQNKPLNGFSAVETNASSNNMIMFSANLIQDTSAISSINLFNSTTKEFVAGSSFFLYGIKNS